MKIAWFLAAVFAVCLAVFAAHVEAQTPSIADVNVIPSGCPSDVATDTANPATCYTAVARDCPNASDLELMFSFRNPGSPKGVIVLFTGGAGTAPSAYPGGEATYADDYFAAGYAVVQVAWRWDWEDTTIPVQYTGGTTVTSYTADIKAASCRPATFLKHINDSATFHPSGSKMCAQGSSAGSAAIGYALAWHSASSYLTNVELLSGPVFSDIKQGCMVTSPATGTQSICGTPSPSCSSNTGTTYGCSTGTTAWCDSPLYVAGYLTNVRGWTGDSSCNGSSVTSSGSNTAWANMSIVSSGASFNYSSTGMAGWLCASSTCSGGSCINNSAAEGEYFYNNFTMSQTPLAYRVTGITSCDGAEGVSAGNDPDTSGQTGMAAIEKHMTDNCK